MVHQTMSLAVMEPRLGPLQVFIGNFVEVWGLLFVLFEPGAEENSNLKKTLSLVLSA